MPSADIRRLHSYDHDKVIEHFQRLPRNTLQQRFGCYVNPGFVLTYAEHVLETDSVIYGAFVHNTLRALGELRPTGHHPSSVFEAAFSVEPAWQTHGLGSALLTRLLTATRNRGISKVVLRYDVTNTRIAHMARKHGARVSHDSGDASAELAPAPLTAMRFATEMGDAHRNIAHAFLHWSD